MRRREISIFREGVWAGTGLVFTGEVEEEGPGGVNYEIADCGAPLWGNDDVYEALELALDEDLDGGEVEVGGVTYQWEWKDNEWEEFL